MKNTKSPFFRFFGYDSLFEVFSAYLKNHLNCLIFSHFLGRIIYELVIFAEILSAFSCVFIAFCSFSLLRGRKTALSLAILHQRLVFCTLCTAL